MGKDDDVFGIFGQIDYHDLLEAKKVIFFFFFVNVGHIRKTLAAK